jgi:hypothetical protein
MALREEISRKISKKLEDIRSLQEQIRDCNIYISSLQDVLKMLPRDSEAGKETVLRHGSLLSQAREAIRKAGHPLHVTEILQSIGRPATKGAKLALSGSLATYVRRQDVFTRPEPNTFGLIELNVADTLSVGDHLNDEFVEIEEKELGKAKAV